MPLYSLIHANGCGRVAFHYTAEPEANQPLLLDKGFTIHGGPLCANEGATCSTCGGKLAPNDVRVDWFIREVVH